MYQDSNYVPNIDVRSSTTPTAGWTILFFYNINTVFKYSTKKKDLNPKMKMGTNSFSVHIVKPIARRNMHIAIKILQHAYCDKEIGNFKSKGANLVKHIPPHPWCQKLTKTKHTAGRACAKNKLLTYSCEPDQNIV